MEEVNTISLIKSYLLSAVSQCNIENGDIEFVKTQVELAISANFNLEDAEARENLLNYLHMAVSYLNDNNKLEAVKQLNYALDEFGQ